MCIGGRGEWRHLAKVLKIIQMKCLEHWQIELRHPKLVDVAANYEDM